MLVAEIIIKSNIDPTLKRIIEKLYYTSKDLVEKNSLKEYYSEQVEYLQAHLKEKLNTIKQLNAEKKTLKTESKAETIELPPIECLKNLTKVNEVNTKFSPLFALFQLLNTNRDMSSLHKSINEGYKDLVSCSCAMVIKRGVEKLYEGVLFDNKVKFYNLDKYFASKVPTVNNLVLAEDEIPHCIKVCVLYKVNNYMVVPYYSNKDKPISKIIVFINKKDEKGGVVSFTKLDEAIAILGCNIAHTILKYHKLLARFENFKNIKKVVYDNINELIAYAIFTLTI